MIEQKLKGIPIIYGLAKRVRYTIRRLIGSVRIRRALARHRSWKIVVGASDRFEPGWIPTEIEVLNIVKPRDWARLFSPGSIDALLAEHVWEHLTEEEGVAAARLCLKYLKPGGYLRMAVPDGLHPDPEYIAWVKVGGCGTDADSHRMLYTYRTLEAVFRRAGFDVDLYEYYDEEGTFHCRDWDPAGGIIRRSRRFDHEERGRPGNYTSIVLDAKKAPGGP